MSWLKSVAEELGVGAGWLVALVLAIPSGVWTVWQYQQYAKRKAEERFDKCLGWLRGDSSVHALRAVSVMHEFARGGGKWPRQVADLFCTYIRDGNRSGPARDEAVRAIVQRMFVDSGERSVYGGLNFNLEDAKFPVGCQLANGEFKHVKFKSAKLRHCDFGKSALTDVDMTDVVCEASTWEKARLEHVRFDGANLNDSQWEQSEMSDIRVVGATMKRAQIREVEMQGVRLERVDLCGASIAGLRVYSERWWLNDFRGAKISNCNFSHVDFHKADFRSVAFVNVSFEGCKFGEAKFDGATFENVRGLPDMDGHV